MVKRQTVWLSTMMVLSLMLIGYYTMNNGNPAGSTSPDTSITTTTDNNPSATAGNNNAAAPTMAGTQPQPTVSDMLINDQSKVTDQLTKREGTDLKIISNSNASSDEIQNASNDLKQAQALSNGISNAISAVEAQGYAGCAVVPTATGGADVYVQSKSLTSLKAAEILDAVSQSTGISADNIHVFPQS